MGIIADRRAAEIETLTKMPLSLLGGGEDFAVEQARFNRIDDLKSRGTAVAERHVRQMQYRQAQQGSTLG